MRIMGSGRIPTYRYKLNSITPSTMTTIASHSISEAVAARPVNCVPTPPPSVIHWGTYGNIGHYLCSQSLSLLHVESIAWVTCIETKRQLGTDQPSSRQTNEYYNIARCFVILRFSARRHLPGWSPHPSGQVKPGLPVWSFSARPIIILLPFCDRTVYNNSRHIKIKAHERRSLPGQFEEGRWIFLVAKHKEQHLAKVDSEGGSPTTAQRREKRKSKECLWGIYSNMCGYDSNGHLSGVL